MPRIAPTLLLVLSLPGCPRPGPPPLPAPVPASQPSAPGSAPASAPASRDESIDFCLQEGASENCLLRDGQITAHVVVTSGPRGRVVVAFPAGNSGGALWLVPPDGKGKVELRVSRPPRSVVRGNLRGVRFQLQSLSPLRMEQVLLGSIRTIRTYHHEGKLEHRDRIVDAAAGALAAMPEHHGLQAAALGFTPQVLRQRARTALSVEREARPARLLARAASLDGKHRFELRLVLPHGRVEGRDLHAQAAPFALDLELLGSHRPLRGLAPDEILRPAALELLQRRGIGPGSKPLRNLALLATRHKYLAGSWRFLTYFGRDTLMTVWMLLPVLRPEAVEIGLQSVLDRLAPDGRVAHEESLGDQAALERLEHFVALVGQGRYHDAVEELGRLGQPVHDYKMVDDDFMLPCVLAAYLDDKAVSAARARAFVGRGDNLAAVARNLDLVLRRAGQPDALIGLQPGLPVGDWRDSNEGLGGGRYPASVNLYLVPAALEAAVRLLGHPKLDRSALQRTARTLGLRELLGQPLQRVRALKRRWRRQRDDFRVRLDHPQQRIRSFLAAMRSPLERRLLLRRPVRDGLTLEQALQRPATLSALAGFDALALDGRRRPVEVMHSDDALALLAQDLPRAELARRLVKYELAYPVGLYDPLGVFVASPVYSRRPDDRATFDRGHYHGTVVWAWQLGLLQLGLARQYRRLQRGPEAGDRELARRVRALLVSLKRITGRVGALRDSELWSVRPGAQGFEAAAYGHGAGQTTESNALQLWSAVHLAVVHAHAELGL